MSLSKYEHIFEKDARIFLDMSIIFSNLYLNCDPSSLDRILYTIISLVQRKKIRKM